MGRGATASRPIVTRRKLLRIGVLALAVLAALIAWLATRGDDGGSSETAAVPGAPRVVTEAELAEASADLGQPIYWAGPIPGKELELTELGEGGGVQVAYLPEGAEAGAGGAGSLTVGSYPLADPQKALKGFAGRPGASVKRASDGREVVASAEAPTSVYFAGADDAVQVQVEVYDPSPQRAMSLAVSGKVQPIG